jgi:hypothetical protein
MKKLITFALLGAFLAVGCGDDKKKTETTKKVEETTKKTTESGPGTPPK